MTGLLRLLDRPRAVLAVAVGTLVVLSGAGLLAASGALVTGAAGRPESLLLLMPLITAVRAFGLSRAALRYVERLLSHDVSLRLVARLRVRLFEMLIPLSPAALTGARSGELLARLRADVDELQGVFVRLYAPAAVAVLAGAVTVGLVAAVDPATAVVLVVLLAVLGVAVPWWARRRGGGASTDRALADTAYGADTLDLVSGLSDVLTGDGGATATRTLAAHARRLAAAERRTAGITAVTVLWREAIPGLGLIAALWLVGSRVHDDGTPPGLLAATALGVLASFEAVAALGSAWAAAEGLTAAAERVDALADRRPEVRDPVAPRPLPDAATLAYENVTLGYPGARQPVVSGVDLTLTVGEKVALVGRSGAGKTSLLLAALRSRDPVAGRITFGGVDLRDLRLAELRSRFAWSAQDPQIHGGTLAGNLRLADTAASEPALEAMLVRVGLVDVIAAVGLHGWIGESGERLSAGERARVSLARLLLSPAPILLVDEPTAHLDAALGTEIVQILVEEPRTVLMTTHEPQLLDGRWRTHPLGVPD